VPGVAYSEALWAEWCNQRRATPIPGALEFTRAAAAKGVTVFYVTNRDRALEQATRDNLAKYGFPLDASRDTVLTRSERARVDFSEKSRGAASWPRISASCCSLATTSATSSRARGHAGRAPGAVRGACPRCGA